MKKIVLIFGVAIIIIIAILYGFFKYRENNNEVVHYLTIYVLGRIAEALEVDIQNFFNTK